MKKLISFIRIKWLRHKWRCHFNLFLRQGKTPFEAADYATEAVNAVVHCFGLSEQVIPYDPLSFRLSLPREQKNAEGQQE